MRVSAAPRSLTLSTLFCACPQENGKVEEEDVRPSQGNGPELPPRPFPFQTQARPPCGPASIYPAAGGGEGHTFGRPPDVVLALPVCPSCAMDCCAPTHLGFRIQGFEGILGFQGLRSWGSCGADWQCLPGAGTSAPPVQRRRLLGRIRERVAPRARRPAAPAARPRASSPPRQRPRRGHRGVCDGRQVRARAGKAGRERPDPPAVLAERSLLPQQALGAHDIMACGACCSMRRATPHFKPMRHINRVAGS